MKIRLAPGRGMNDATFATIAFATVAGDVFAVFAIPTMKRHHEKMNDLFDHQCKLYCRGVAFVHVPDYTRIRKIVNCYF
jgi:hypothetical protein